MSDISVCHAIAGLHPESGGTSRVVVDVTDALGKVAGISPVLITQSLAGGATVPSTDIGVQRIIAETESSNSLRLGLPFRSALKSLTKKGGVKLIHNHGIWMSVNHWASRIARSQHIPLVIQPHGMLEDWALAYRRQKKLLALRLYQYRDLESAALLIATATKEVDSIRKLGLRQPVAVIPNGIELQVVKPKLPQQKELANQSCNVLFLSRIHPIKGLINLIEAWGRIGPVNGRLRIAGPDEAGHLAEVMERVKLLGLSESVEFFGMVEGETKVALFEDADLFILPSYSENFGVVVAEALAYGVPVITTHGTPWSGLSRHDCGWWVEPTVDALSLALREAINLEATDLHAMGERGREYVKKFEWTNIAEQTADVYRWVLGQGARPDCVVTE